MADNINDGIDADDTDDTKPKNGLRTQLEAALEAKKALEQELASLKGQVRERTVSDVLQAKGVNPKVAKFIPSDVEGADAIGTWLTENADIFGFKVSDEVAAEATGSNPAVAETQRLQQLNQSASSPTKLQDLEARIAAAGSDKEVEEIWAEAKKFIL